MVHALDLDEGLKVVGDELQTVDVLDAEFVNMAYAAVAGSARNVSYPT
jgi:hypothetical protein